MPLIIAICALPLCACVGTEVGNPQDREVTIEFTAAPLEDPRALTLSNGIELDEAWIAVEEVGLRESARCEDSERFDDESPFSVELLAGIEAPSAPMLVPEASEFCRLELELETLAEVTGNVPEALQDDSVYLTGRLEDGTPFEVRAEVSETIRLDGPFTISSNTKFLVAFDVSQWVVPADFDNVVADPDGVLRLDAEVDGAAIERLSDAVQNSGRLVRDINRNGVFDPDDIVVATSVEAEDTN